MPSAVIKAFVYNAQDRTLTITFVSGRVYVYQAVPADVAEGLKLAFAKGRYFNRAIRDRFAGAPAPAGTDARPATLI